LVMDELERGKVDRPETYPTICPRCHSESTLKLSARPSIATLRLKADGSIEKEPGELKLQYGLTCPRCLGRYWMLIGFVAGKADELRVSTHPLLSAPENMKQVESGEVFYSQAKKWWFYKRGGRIKEIGPGEPPDTSLS
jgi:hypothetical protein